MSEKTTGNARESAFSAILQRRIGFLQFRWPSNVPYSRAEIDCGWRSFDIAGIVLVEEREGRVLRMHWQVSLRS